MSMRELRQKEKEAFLEMSRLNDKNGSELVNEFGYGKEKEKGSGYRKLLDSRERGRVSLGKSDKMVRRSEEKSGKLRLPKMRLFNELLQSTLRE
jgi:hypothetical protein